MDHSISLIMPAFNEGAYLESAVKSAVAKLKKLGFDYEIFIFNDASSDNTGEVADKLASEDLKIKVFHNPENMNLGYNFARGIDMATKTYAGLLPCHDLIEPDSYDVIFPAFQKYCKDLVIGYIANPEIRPMSRRVVSWTNVQILNLFFGFGLRYYHLNFYRTSLLKKLPKSTKSYALMVELLIQALISGATYIEVPFCRRERLVGKSKAMRLKNIFGILKTYARIFWRLRILRQKVDLS